MAESKSVAELRNWILQNLPARDCSQRKKAVREVVDAYCSYRKFLSIYADLPSGANIRAELSAIQKSAAALSDRLSKLRPEAKALIHSAYEHYARALPPETDIHRRDNFLWLKDGMRFAKTLSCIAGTGAGRVARSPTRDDRAPLDNFVLTLAQIWKRYTACQFTRARKAQKKHQILPRDFVQAVFKLLIVRASDAQIELAMARAAKTLRAD
jgi:hypothetical protein